MTVNWHCSHLFFALFLASVLRNATAIETQPCYSPYSCVPTSECAERHAARGTEEVLFRCEGNKVCCPPIKSSSASSTQTDANQCNTTGQSNFEGSGKCSSQSSNTQFKYHGRQPQGSKGSQHVYENHTHHQHSETRPFSKPQRPVHVHTQNENSYPQVPQSGNSPSQTTQNGNSYPQVSQSGGFHPSTSQSGNSRPQTSQTGSSYPQASQGTGAFRPSTSQNGNSRPQPSQNGNFRPQPSQTDSSYPQVPQTGTSRPSNSQNGNSHPQVPQTENSRPQPSQSENSYYPIPQAGNSRPQTGNSRPKPTQIPNSNHNSLSLDSDKPQSSITSHKNFHLLPSQGNCGVNNFANRITEGEEVSLGEFPWMVLTGLKDRYGNYRWNCGGTLINEWYVLTAAHCLVVDNRTIEYVRLGEHNLANETDCFRELCLEKPEDIAIAEVIPHEKWNTTTIKNDIALLRLAKNPLKLGKSNIYPICLPVEVDKLNITSNTKYEVAGWGKTDWNADEGSDVLRKASLSGVSREECNICKDKKKQQYCPIVDTQLCIQGWKAVDVCKGDSGGPLMVSRLNIFQIGITSFKGSEYCGAENIPSIFTKVESYMPWILDNIRA